MKVKLTNKTGGELVDTLKNGKTLRLFDNATTTIDETEMTPHINTLISKGLVLSEIEKTPTPKKSKETK